MGLNAKTLIKLLSDNVAKNDRESAVIEIWCGEQQYEIERISGFAISPDISILIKPVKSSIVQPFKYKSKHKRMVKRTMNKLKAG